MKEMKIQQGFTEWFKRNTTLTLDQFRSWLKQRFPEESWGNVYVAKWLFENSEEYIDRPGEARVYTAPNQLTSSELLEYCDILTQSGKHITKTNLKSLVRRSNKTVQSFKDLFDSLNLTFTGKYTVDNHKIYVLHQPTQHYSKTKDEIMQITDMHKKHLINTIKNAGRAPIGSIIEDPDSELYKLLFAYFTYDIREQLHKII